MWFKKRKELREKAEQERKELEREREETRQYYKTIKGYKYMLMKQADDPDSMLSWTTEQLVNDLGELNDGFHTFNELYDYRMLYNAAFFNSLAYYDNWADGSWHVEYNVHKSKKHHDGEECFGGWGFIVMADLPTGQISNHYAMEYWDLFQIPEKEIADEWDGHTPKEAAERLKKYLEENVGSKG